MNKQQPYVLITTARNEARFIERTIQTIVAQSLLPKRWIIVSDGSTDETDDIVKQYGTSHPWILLMRRESTRERNFRNMAFAINEAYQTLQEVDFQFIGTLDADITLEPDYYQNVLQAFAEDDRIGLAGGVIFENYRGQFKQRPGNRPDAVAGAIQFFRRDCFEGIGGYVPMQYGGLDTVAMQMARMKGWKVKVIQDLPVYHHRKTGTAGLSVLGARFREGGQDYHIGNHPLYQFAKFFRRIFERPYVISSFARLLGYLRLWIRRRPMELPDEFVKYMRERQMQMMLRPFKKSRAK